jgi:hypothetical protein
MISGHGSVYVQNVGSCDYQAAPCQLVVPLSHDVILAGFGSEDWRFDNWSEGPCKGSKSAACVFPPSLTMVVSAKFHKD